MAPYQRYHCKECKKELKPNKYGKIVKHSANSMERELHDRNPADGMPYNCNVDGGDWFCPACRMSIKRSHVAVPSPVERDERLDQAQPHNFENEQMIVDDGAGLEFETQENEVNVEESQMLLSENNIVAMQNVEVTYSASESSSFSNSENIHPNFKSNEVNWQKNQVFLHTRRFLASTEKKCCVCDSKESKNRSRIPRIVWENFLLETNVWMPKNNRCCPHHYESGRFLAETTKSLVNQSTAGCSLTSNEIEEWMSLLEEEASQPRINVNSGNLDDSDYKLLFGVNKENFDHLFNTIKYHLYYSHHRSPRTALAVFLAKLRLGVSQKLLGFLFDIPQPRISKIIARVSELLEKYFVPKNLGLYHKSREEFIAENDLEFARKLYVANPGSIILILDGTYLYVEKSGDHTTQHGTFSVQKGRNLVKVMMVVTATGYIVDAIGCYFSDGKHNDASILKDMLSTPNGMKDFVKPGDIFILDRGFRDVIPELKKLQIRTEIPMFLRKKQAQFTTDEANDSRKVTLTRWVVEAVNGRLKNMFKFFDITIPAQYFNDKCSIKLNRYLRIACAVMNKFCPPISRDSPEQQQFLETIREKEKVPNKLMDDVLNNKKEYISGRKCWKEIRAKELIEFPKFSLAELHELSGGKFNVKSSRGYTDAHLKVDSDYRVKIHVKHPCLLRISLKSKYRSGKGHKVWIKFSCQEESQKILGHYCQCMAGARTVTLCGHITSVLWFLGYKRHQEPSYVPRSFGADIIDLAAKKVQETEEFGLSDDDEVEQNRMLQTVSAGEIDSSGSDSDF